VELGNVCQVRFREPIHLCTSVSEEGGAGEGVGSEVSSLLSYTRRYVSLTELGNVCHVGFREPMHLCTCVSKEWGAGEGAGSEAPSLLSYTLGYVSLAEFW
jgi:hypothetical protein